MIESGSVQFGAHLTRVTSKGESALSKQDDRETTRESSMMTFLFSALIRLQTNESGQGLVEYLLILALIAFAATAGMHTVASTVNSAFTQVASMLAQYIA
jgi:pilus assembly protein Flp/PilA